MHAYIYIYIYIYITHIFIHARQMPLTNCNRNQHQLISKCVEFAYTYIHTCMHTQTHTCTHSYRYTCPNRRCVRNKTSANSIKLRACMVPQLLFSLYFKITIFIPCVPVCVCSSLHFSRGRQAHATGKRLSVCMYLWTCTAHCIHYVWSPPLKTELFKYEQSPTFPTRHVRHTDSNARGGRICCGTQTELDTPQNLHSRTNLMSRP